MFKYTDEIKNFILKNYKGIGNEELKNLINKKFNTNLTTSQIKSYKANHKLNSGLTGHFYKGRVPHNKGKKMPLKQYEKCKNTMFKKGNVPQNHRPVGSERVGKDGYMQIKVAEPNKWQQKNVYIYEKHYGKIPKGYKVIFLDQNKYNFSIENLACVSNREHAVMCKKRRYTENAELTQVGKTLTELEFKLKEIKQ